MGMNKVKQGDKKLLDLFSGAGGAAMGYYRAGFKEIVGVDIEPQPRYPFDFIQADALNPPVNLNDFDLIHASPPCQRFSTSRSFNKNRYGIDWWDYPDLLTPCREILKGHKYIIENVPGAPLRIDVMLCGTMFGLGVFRHRWFELSIRGATRKVSLAASDDTAASEADATPFAPILILTQPCNHNGTVKDRDYFCVVNNGGLGMTSTPYARKAECATAMGIDWMTRKEMTQAIPPKYTEFIGKAIWEQL